MSERGLRTDKGSGTRRAKGFHSDLKLQVTEAGEKR